MLSAYERLSPVDKKEEKSKPSEVVWNDDEDHTGVVNILSAVDVRHPITTDDDLRRGAVADQFKRILRDRDLHRLITAKDEKELKAYIAAKGDS